MGVQDPHNNYNIDQPLDDTLNSDPTDPLIRDSSIHTWSVFSFDLLHSNCVNQHLNQPLFSLQREMNKHRILTIGLLLLLALPLNAQEASEGKVEIEKHKVGHSRVNLPGAWAMTFLRATYDFGENVDAEKARRVNSGKLKWFTAKGGEGVSYEINVPKSYQPGNPHGVIVHVSASPKGKFPYVKLLGDHNLISVSANKSGNETGTLLRHTYAVQAVEMIAERYDIDRDRIYISGTSGGGRCASQVMIMNCDTFTGGIPLIGANPCIPMKNSSSADGKKPGTYYQDSGAWKKPNRSLLTQAAKNGRYVFMTGEKDFNRQNVKAVSQGYQKAGFSQVHYIEQPGLKHGNPSPK